MQGTISGITYPTYAGILSGATISCAGLTTVSDEYGFYSLNVPIGNNIINCSAPDYITNALSVSIVENLNILNITDSGAAVPLFRYPNKQYSRLKI